MINNKLFNCQTKINDDSKLGCGLAGFWNVWSRKRKAAEYRSADWSQSANELQASIILSFKMVFRFLTFEYDTLWVYYFRILWTGVDSVEDGTATGVRRHIVMNMYNWVAILWPLRYCICLRYSITYWCGRRGLQLQGLSVYSEVSCWWRNSSDRIKVVSRHEIEQHFG